MIEPHSSSLNLDRMSVVCAALALALVPILLLTIGYLPVDDALRHAGMGMTDRSWGDILLLKPEITMDSHPGWHAILRAVRQTTGAGAMDLVFGSVVLLFFLVSGLGLAFTQRPVPWLAALLFFAIFDANIVLRWIIGRPLLLSTATLLAIVLSWERGPLISSAREYVLWALAFSALSWIHPSFYLFVLPVAALAVCRRFKEAIVLASLCLVGSFGGALLTGDPLEFYRQAMLHPYLSLGKDATSLVGEFQPTDGSPLVILATLVVLSGLRDSASRLQNLTSLFGDPTLVLVLTGWILGFVNRRFWWDWGAPALLVLIAREITARMDLALQTPRARFAATLGLSAILGLTLCTDRAGRWSRRDVQFAPLARPENAFLLPDPGGVLYSDSMYLFYSVFVRKPDAPFRYVLGFEAGWMRDEDEIVYRESLRWGYAAMRPWVDKMRPQDRLIISATGRSDFPELEWTRATGTLWSGRRRPSQPGQASRPPK